MRRLPPGILPVVLVALIGCGGSPDAAGPTNLEQPDTRSTGELAAADGNFRVRFTLAVGVPPKVPLQLSFDGREPDLVTLSQPLDERRYRLDPGMHNISVTLPQASCGLNRAFDADSTHPIDRFLVLEDHVGNYQVDVDCTSVLDTWGIRVTSYTEVLDHDGFTLTLTNPEFGTRTEHLPPEGKVTLLGYHVGWYKLHLTDVDPNCTVRGLGAPGWVGVNDSIQIKPYSGAIFYWVNCS